MGNVPYSRECEDSSEKQDDHHLSEERMLAAGASGVPGRVRKSTLHVCSVSSVLWGNQMNPLVESEHSNSTIAPRWPLRRMFFPHWGLITNTRGQWWPIEGHNYSLEKLDSCNLPVLRANHLIMPSVTGSQFCTQHTEDRIKVSLFYSALNMVELAHCADLYFLPLQSCLCEHSYPGKTTGGICDFQA